MRRTPQEGLYDHLIAAHHRPGPWVGEQILSVSAPQQRVQWPEFLS